MVEDIAEFCRKTMRIGFYVGIAGVIGVFISGSAAWAKTLFFMGFIPAFVSAAILMVIYHLRLR